MSWNSKGFKIIAALIPVIMLAILSIKPIDTIRSGRDIKLKAKLQTWEYRDGTRGYLEYEIGNLELEDFSEKDREKFKEEFPYNETVYAYLKEGEDGIYELEKISFEKGDGLHIRGTLQYYEEEPLPEKEEYREEDYRYDYEKLTKISARYNLKYEVGDIKDIGPRRDSIDALVNYKIKYDSAVYDGLELYE